MEEGFGGRCAGFWRGVPGAERGEVWRRCAVALEYVNASEYSFRLRSSCGRNFSGV